MVDSQGKRKRTILLTLLFLILLSITIRFPYLYGPHERGTDSFFYHKEVNVLLHYHAWTWFLHPLSLWGLYPYSDSPGAPFYVAEISMLAGIPVSSAIIIFDIIITIIGVIGGFLLGLKIRNNLFFAVILALAISLAPKAIGQTIYTLNERGALVLLLPLWILFMIWNLKIDKKSIQDKHKKWKIAILFALYTFVLSTVHLIFFFSVSFLLAYLIIIIEKKIHLNIRLPWRVSACKKYIIILIFIMLFYSMFWLTALLGNLGYSFRLFFNIKLYEQSAILKGTDPLSIAINIAVSITGGVGFFFILFAIPGILVTIFKKRRDFVESFLLLSLMILTPLMINRIYIRPFLISIFSIYMAVGAEFMLKKFLTFKKRDNRNIKRSYKKCAVVVITLFILISMSFSGYMVKRWDSQRCDTTATHMNMWMSEKTFNTAIWMKYKSKGIFTSNNIFRAERVESYSDAILLPGMYDTSLSNIVLYKIYNNISDLKIEKTSMGKILGLKSIFFNNNAKWREMYGDYINLMNMNHYKKIRSKYNISLFLYYNQNNTYSAWYDQNIVPSKFCKNIELGKLGYAIFKNDDFSLYLLSLSY